MDEEIIERPAQTSGAAPHNWAEREAMVATAAYLRAQKRGFAPGHELEDWLAAEAAIDGRDQET
ncbi:MAG: DUF2934 domain-containing protein [Nevskia sp.]|nr:DUF2934 domain-containing protein [Nevskia sp.]